MIKQTAHPMTRGIRELAWLIKEQRVINRKMGWNKEIHLTFIKRIEEKLGYIKEEFKKEHGCYEQKEKSN